MFMSLNWRFGEHLVGFDGRIGIESDVFEFGNNKEFSSDICDDRYFKIWDKRGIVAMWDSSNVPGQKIHVD